MTVAAILEIIKGVLNFPTEVLALVRALRDTPEESREKIMAAIQVEQDKFSESGRPSWDS